VPVMEGIAPPARVSPRGKRLYDLEREETHHGQTRR
jgi:hypothetical protein